MTTSKNARNVDRMTNEKEQAAQAEHIDISVRIPAPHVERFNRHGARIHAVRPSVIALSLILGGLEAAEKEGGAV